jgi:hypothetical protein
MAAIAQHDGSKGFAQRPRVARARQRKAKYGYSRSFCSSSVTPAGIIRGGFIDAHLSRSAKMQEIRAIGSGEMPTADEADDGLARLQGIVDGLFGNTVLEDVETDEGLEMETDTRYLVFASGPLMFSLPESPKNGARIQVQDMLGAFGTYPLTIEASPANIVLDAHREPTPSSISRTAQRGLVSRRSRSTACFP